MEPFKDEAAYHAALLRGYWADPIPGYFVLDTHWIFTRRRTNGPLVSGAVNKSPENWLLEGYKASVGKSELIFDTLEEAKAWVECRVAVLAQKNPMSG